MSSPIDPIPTPQQIADLKLHATNVAHHAYAPYSGFRVGAAVLLSDGTIVTGCNVENASYRLTTCAEQSAITSAVTNLNHAASPPCGACRQTIHEFSAPDTLIYFPTGDGAFSEATTSELLPAAFLLTK